LTQVLSGFCQSEGNNDLMATGSSAFSQTCSRTRTC
jgi:hypothetical protein